MMDKAVLSNKAFKYVNMDEIDFQKDILNVLERIAYKGSIDGFFLRLQGFMGMRGYGKQ